MSADILNEVRVVTADVFAVDPKTLNAGSSLEQAEDVPLCVSTPLNVGACWI
jgi:hypothetical protein